MTREEQVAFVRGLMARKTEELVALVRHVPEDWDGVELRRLCFDALAMEVRRAPSRDYRAFLRAPRRFTEEAALGIRWPSPRTRD